MAVSRLAGAVEGMPRLLLRLEGLGLALAAVYTYYRVGANWWLFACLIVVPDVSLIAYLGGTRFGAISTPGRFAQYPLLPIEENPCLRPLSGRKPYWALCEPRLGATASVASKLCPCVSRPLSRLSLRGTSPAASRLRSQARARPWRSPCRTSRRRSSSISRTCRRRMRASRRSSPRSKSLRESPASGRLGLGSDRGARQERLRPGQPARQPRQTPERSGKNSNRPASSRTRQRSSDYLGVRAVRVILGSAHN